MEETARAVNELSELGRLEALVRRRAEAAEQALWSAERACEEHAETARLAADRARERGDVDAADELARLAEVAAGRARNVAALADDSGTGPASRPSRVEVEFVENAAHQLRSPVAAISSAVAALLQGAKDEPEERERFVEHIARETARMQRLTETLLALARLQHGLARPSIGVSPLRPLLVDVVAATKAEAQVELDCPEEIAVVGDVVMITEAISNVVQNALEHGGGTPVSISARLNRSTLVVDVADRGAGVSHEARDRIFDRFVRARPGPARGSGLGLAIAREAVRANRGSLELLDTEPGATFRFTLAGARVL